ncbi:rhamnulokinase family protein [uncultured Mitsuokella sp.]|uniref:rhamnulokinase n=1 Tax=uncultured Mitsuokella sp. TaxID=453120 RepID=UPI002630D878|nr:rhamnulokinase family protein [uncultured Mitsuokella sp.]
MAKTKRVLAVDFGASSGRVMCAEFDGARIALRELHRFSNDPVIVRGTMYWDVLRLFHEIKQGLLKAKSVGPIDSMAVDTWGVDFALLDGTGNLLENPVHYRDKRTSGMLEEVFRHISAAELYAATGNQLMEINTAFQLRAVQRRRPDLLARAETLLMMPDLFHYMLTGEACAEVSIASTTQLMDAQTQDWSQEVLKALGLPPSLFPHIVPSGTRIGRLDAQIAEELGIERIPVIAVAGHDTQSAMVSVPTKKENFVFLSCGTWSLLGTELRDPILTEKARLADYTNERGYGGRVSFLKNIIGLWLVQESRRQWMREGRSYAFGELEQMAGKTKPFQSLVDPDAPEFVPSGDLPKRIRAYCERTHQHIPQSEGEIIRCIDESLALKYRAALAQLEDCVPETRGAEIHILGGGVQSGLLCQMTADACGRNILAGPIEATVMGNVLVQLLASGALGSLEEARQAVRDSEPCRTYVPADPAAWDAAYEKWKEIVAC